MSVKIIFEKKKALKINYQETEFWIQKRWLNKNNELTPSGVKAYEKAKNSKPFELEDYTAWENDGCIGVDVYVTLDSYLKKRGRLFISKSKLTSGCICSNLLKFLIESKAKEVNKAQRMADCVKYDTTAIYLKKDGASHGVEINCLL